MRRIGPALVVLALAGLPRTAASEPRIENQDDDLDGVASFGLTIRKLSPRRAERSAVLRSSTGVTLPDPEAETAYSVVKQFVLATTAHTHFGYEVEVTPGLDGGRDPSARRMAAGAQLVAGIRGGLPYLDLRAELAGGLRLFENDVDEPVLEARVRGDLWLTSQVTLGAALGKSLLDERDWITAVYIAVHTAWRDPP